MKKFLVVLLILAVAGGVFAQELKLSGLVNSGLQVNIDNNNKVTAKAYAWDAGKDVIRFRLNGAFTMENMGINFRFHSETTDAAPLSLAFGYGYVNLLDNMVQIKGGKVDDGTYNSMGAIDGDVDEGVGGQIHFKPIKGLSLGYGMYAPGAEKEIAMIKYTAGVAYAMDKMFKVTSSISFDAGQYRKAMGGLNVMVLPALTFIAEYVTENIENPGTSGRLLNAHKDTPFTLTEKVAYKITNEFNAGITSYQFFNGIVADVNDKHNPLRNNFVDYSLTTPDWFMADYNAGFFVEPWVSYAFGSIVPQLAVKFALHNSEDKPAKTEFSINEVRIKPSVRFNLPMASWIDVAYEMHVLNWSAKVDGDAVSKSDLKDAGFKTNWYNRLYVDFVWKF